MSLLQAIIFISGGAILALELLASRVMTPYFGVSLYIWTGILSITLISLAAGYWAGGRVAALPRNAAPEQLMRLFALMPAVAAIAIVGACLTYPFLFAGLAGWSLVLGAFTACMILLFLPLVATSAMNPLLVAITLRRNEQTGGDAGAGKVFFVSTIGSVAGVIVTAFAIIPYLSNFSAMLLVASSLSVLALVTAAALPREMRAGVGAVAIAGLLASVLLMWQADRYTGRLGPARYGASDWTVEARLGSLFGTVKILRSNPDSSGQFQRVYFQDGLIQNTVDSTGRSVSFYTYALEALGYAYQPELRTALVLGLGAGIVPRQLAARGVAVEVVEIDPVSPVVAQRYFGFDPKRVRLHQADARTFVSRCSQGFDLVVVDLFHGDGTPEYLVTREFFRGLRRCLGPRGVAVFNTFADRNHPQVYAHLLATLRAELPHVVLHQPDWPNAVHLNSFIVAAARPLGAPGRVTLDYVPPRHESALWAMLAKPQPLDDDWLDGGVVITDAYSAAAHQLAVSQIEYRRVVVEALPPAFLLN